MIIWENLKLYLKNKYKDLKEYICFLLLIYICFFKLIYVYI